MNTIEAFLSVFAVGGVISAATWLFARKRIQRSWQWRAAFCVMLAATIAPSVFYFWSSWAIWPAVFMLFAAFDGGKQGFFAFLLGATPILVVAAVIFTVWSILLWRKKHESHVV